MPLEMSPRMRRSLGDESRRRVTAIDGLRVLAMLSVVIYHANATWLPGGFLGVTVFFAISGYLITDGLLRELRTTSSIDVMRFYRRRLVRLVPQMILVVAATALLCAILAPQLLGKMRGDVLPALLFFENWWYIVREQSYFAASGQPSPITHFWFLSVLMQFYLAWPLILALLSRVARSRSAQRRVVAVFAIASAILAAVLYDPRRDPSRVYYGTDTRLAEILVGAWAAYAFPTDGTTSFGKGLVNRFPALQSALATDLIGLVALVVLGILMFVMNGYSPFLYRGGLLLVSALTSVVLAVVARPESVLARPLGIYPFSVLSARTFGIYLWHYPLLLVMNPATRTTQIPWWGWLLEALAIVAAVELSYHFIERPFAQLIDSRGKKPSRDASERLGRRPSEPQPQSAIPYMGALGVACGIAALLLVVGPFWYSDGASQQAEPTPDPKTTVVEPDATDLVKWTVDTAHNAVIQENKRIQEEAAAAARESLKAHNGDYEVNQDTGMTDAPVLLIGDSVPEGAVTQFEAMFPNGLIDTEVGRQLYTAYEVYQDYLASGDDHHVVVFASGDNGVAQEEDVRAMIEAAGKDRQVYLVTVRVPLPLQDMNNELFRTVAAEYDNVGIIDWYAESEGHDEYFWDDGTHLRPEGAEAYVLMLRRAIAGE